MSLEITSLFGIGAWLSPPTASRRRFGVPPGGPWAREAAQLALALVGKDESGPIFEMLQGSVSFLAQASGSVCVIGRMGEVKVGGSTYRSNSRIGIQAGQILQVGAHYAYISFTQAILPHVTIEFETSPTGTLRFLHNGAASSLGPLTVDPASNRAGIRLNGLPPNNLSERPSEPCCVGTIQQTPSGQLILIGPDGPTIGGYPKLGSIIEADLDLLPRLVPRQEVKLEAVSWTDAMGASRARESAAKSRLKNLSLIQALPALPVHLL